MPLDHDQFVAWVEALPPQTEFETAHTSLEKNPIAVFLQSQGEAHALASKVQYFTLDQGWQPLPAWARAFLSALQEEAKFGALRRAALSACLRLAWNVPAVRQELAAHTAPAEPAAEPIPA